MADVQIDAVDVLQELVSMGHGALVEHAVTRVQLAQVTAENEKLREQLERDV